MVRTLWCGNLVLMGTLVLNPPIKPWQVVMWGHIIKNLEGGNYLQNQYDLLWTMQFSPKKIWLREHGLEPQPVISVTLMKTFNISSFVVPQPKWYGLLLLMLSVLITSLSLLISVGNGVSTGSLLWSNFIPWDCSYLLGHLENAQLYLF